MKTCELPLPELLTELIRNGKWTPAGTLCGGMFDLGIGAARRLSTNDDQLVLMPPPFHSIADEIRDGNAWWKTDLTNVGEIDYEKAVIIADFGMGSDSPIILYYATLDEPQVLFLKWTWRKRQARHSWARTHATFEAFAADVGLIEAKVQQTGAQNL